MTKDEKNVTPADANQMMSPPAWFEEALNAGSLRFDVLKAKWKRQHGARPYAFLVVEKESDLGIHMSECERRLASNGRFYTVVCAVDTLTAMLPSMGVHWEGGQKLAEKATEAGLVTVMLITATSFWMCHCEQDETAEVRDGHEASPVVELLAEKLSLLVPRWKGLHGREPYGFLVIDTAWEHGKGFASASGILPLDGERYAYGVLSREALQAILRSLGCMDAPTFHAYWEEACERSATSNVEIVVIAQEGGIAVTGFRNHGPPQGLA